MWYNTNTGRTFILYDDGDSKQWVENIPASNIDTNTIAGYVNPVFALTNGSYTTANSAYGKANNALANTSGISTAGDLNVTGKLGVNISPYTGIDINKYGTTWNSDTSTYPRPGGNIFLNMKAIDGANNWFGFTGNYNGTSGSVNILLQQNYQDMSQAAGNYIASEASGVATHSLTFGR